MLRAILDGPRVYLAACGALPIEVPAPPSPHKYWMRCDIAERAGRGCTRAGVVGIGHGHVFAVLFQATGCGFFIRTDWKSR